MEACLYGELNSYFVEDPHIRTATKVEATVIFHIIMKKNFF